MRQITGAGEFADGEVPTYNGTNDRFEPGAGGGGGVGALVGGPGEMIVGDPGGPPYPSTLFPGSDGDVLAIDSGVPTWTPAGGLGGAIPASVIDDIGDVVIGGGADTATILPLGADGQVLTVNFSAPNGLEWAPGSGGALSVLTITGAYTLVLSDAGKFLACYGTTPYNLTVPPESSVDFPIGTVIQGAQLDTATVTAVGGGGAGVGANPGASTAGRYAAFALLKFDSDLWLMTGRLA
jgi:hypothetical protein